MSDRNIETYVRVARKYWLGDDETLAHFKNMMASAPPEVREMINDPVWTVAFIAGLTYAKKRAHDENIERGDMQIMQSILVKTLQALEHMPFTGNRN